MLQSIPVALFALWCACEFPTARLAPVISHRVGIVVTISVKSRPTVGLTRVLRFFGLQVLAGTASQPELQRERHVPVHACGYYCLARLALWIASRSPAKIFVAIKQIMVVDKHLPGRRKI